VFDRINVSTKQNIMVHSEQFLRQLVNQSTNCTFITDQDARLTMVSASARQYFTETSDHLVGRIVNDCVKDAGLLKSLENAQAELRKNQSSFHELAPWNGNGDQFTLQFQGNKVVEDDGTFRGCIYSFTIERSSKELEFEATVLNNLMQNSEDMIYFKDLNSRFTLVSDSTVQRLGADSVDDILGKSDFDFWDEDCAEGFYDDEQEIIRSRKPMIGKAERESRSDGKKTWVLSSKMPLIDQHDNVVGTYGISKDITTHKETEIELELAHKNLLDASRQAGMAEIATNVIHNVGNVLNSINVSISQTNEISKGLKIAKLESVSNMLAEHADEPNFLSEDEKGKQIPDYLSLIAKDLAKDQSSIESELESTRNHLQHVKMIVAMQQEYATANRVIEQVDLADVLDDAIKMSSGSLERHRITLVREFEPGILLMLDKHRVMQILVNLIRNAKHAIQEVEKGQRTIKVAVTQSSDQMVAIEITDNGVGISVENMVNLFNHGFSTKSKGHGFGLHSGANSAKELGGSLTAQSDGIGKGATFTLTLPLQPIQESAAVEAAPILHAEIETTFSGANQVV